MITPALTKLDRRKILTGLGILSPLPSGEKKKLYMDEDQAGQIERQIDLCEAKVLEHARPRAVYRILPREILTLEGSDIQRLLDSCSEAVLMAITLGEELERCMMREEITNISNAYIMDVCASVAAEAAADDFENKLRLELQEKGKYLTNRFSPGYGDLPLSSQQTVLELLNAQRAIGLTLTKTGLMVPRKSITAVLGICDRKKEDILGGCARCPIRTKCSFRAHGTRCYE